MVRRAHLLPLLPLVTFNQMERMIETILLYKHESKRCKRQENEETPPHRGIQGGPSISSQVHITSGFKAISYFLNTNCSNRLYDILMCAVLVVFLVAMGKNVMCFLLKYQYHSVEYDACDVSKHYLHFQQPYMSVIVNTDSYT